MDLSRFIATAQEIEHAHAEGPLPEWVRMLLAILRGPQTGTNDSWIGPGPGEGWFGPAQSRYSWAWLAARHTVALDAGINAEQFLGEAAWFERLDRNADGEITAEDVNWDTGRAAASEAYLTNRILRGMNSTGDGRLTRADWIKFYNAAAAGKDYLSTEDLYRAFVNVGALRAPQGGEDLGPEVLLRMVFSGEGGSLSEGPSVNDPAPDFTLQTNDGRQRIRLADQIGRQPVVLVFGNYTCGPFRTLFVGVDEVCQRFREQAVFLAIYGREAHPTTGWKAELNDRAGVSAAQPATYGERVEVATRCQSLLKPSMPLLVDELHDPTTTAYSGLPARLYVLDRKGEVVYKSGRGPFGFKAGEMEQALVMALLDRP